MPSTPSSTLPDSRANRIAQAAKVSLISPFLVVLIAMLAGRIDGPYRIVAEWLAVALALVGVVCGVAALARGRRSGGNTVAIQGGVGLLINVVFVSIFVTNFVQARQRAQEEQATAGVADMSPKGRRMAESLAAFLAKSLQLEQQLAAAANPLSQTPVLNWSNVDAASAIAERRALVERFLAASRELSNHVGQAEAFLREQMIERGADEGEATMVAVGYLQNLENRRSLSSQMRGIEQAYGETLLQALDLAASEWGRWKADAQGAPVFEREEPKNQYQLLLQRLQEVDRQNEELRRKTLPQ